MPIARNKQLLAGLFDLPGVDAAGAQLQRLYLGRRHLRVVNYHDTPTPDLENLDRQLGYFASRFEDVTLCDLEELLASGRWDRVRPGLVMTFDDGLRSNYQASKLLEEHGRTGWFMIPTAFVDTPPGQQIAFAAAHRIHSSDSFDDGRIALSWDEIREMSQRHVICSHTATHMRMGNPMDAETRRAEIHGSKQRLEAELGKPCDAFAWVGGEETSYDREAAESIRDAGYRFAFMTNNLPITQGTHPLQLQRTNLEADWTLPVVKFQLSGILDLMYTGKRRRVNQLTA